MALKPMDDYNMILMLNRDLEAAIKEVVLDDIVKQQLKEFEEKIRPVVKEEVEKLTFKAIDKMYAGLDDMLALRNDLRIYIQWSDEDKAHLMQKELNVVRLKETVRTTEVDI